MSIEAAKLLTETVNARGTRVRDRYIGTSLTIALLAIQVSGFVLAGVYGGNLGLGLGFGTAAFTIATGVLCMYHFKVGPTEQHTTGSIHLPELVKYILFGAFLPAICLWRRPEILEQRRALLSQPHRDPPQSWMAKCFYNCTSAG